MSSINTYLKENRGKMSQKEIAEKIGVSEKQYQRYEKDHSITPEMLKKICEVLNLDTEEAFQVYVSHFVENTAAAKRQKMSSAEIKVDDSNKIVLSHEEHKALNNEDGAAMQAILRLIDQNELLIKSNADAVAGNREAIEGNREAIHNAKVLAETNKKLADRVLETSTGHVHQETHEAFATMLGNLSELVSEVALGKKYKNRDEVAAVLYKPSPGKQRKGVLEDSLKS